MKKLKFLLLLVFLIGCSSSETAVQTAIAKAQIAQPTLTPTPVDLSLLKLDPVLIQYGDLPAGYTGAQISYNGIPQFLGPNVPVPQNQINQEFEKDGKKQGSIWLAVYKDVSNVKNLYEQFVSGLGDNNTTEYTTKSGVQIKAAYLSINYPGLSTIKNVALTFYKCNYVGYLVISETDEVKGMVNYIERLSPRLDEILDCK